jgi:hypothetical protein
MEVNVSNGIISKTLDWFDHPTYTDTSPLDWFAGFIIVLLMGMLWSKVLRQIVEG